MTSTPPPELDALLARAASSGDPQAARRFTDALLDSTVGVLLATDPGGRVSPVSLPVEDRMAVPFFTTPDKARAAAQGLARPGVRDVPIACRELFTEAVRNNAPLALNPYSPVGKAFTVAEMSDLLAGVEPGARTRVTPADTQLLVGEPAHVPAGLVEGLRNYLGGLDGVDSASLAWVQYPDGLQGYLLVVRTALPRETVNAGINEPASNTDGRTIDVLVVAPGASDPASGVSPFYSAT